MRQLAVPAAALFAVTLGVAVAAEVKSGLEPGAAVGAYNVLDVTGPDQGKKLCLR